MFSHDATKDGPRQRQRRNECLARDGSDGRLRQLAHGNLLVKPPRHRAVPTTPPTQRPRTRATFFLMTLLCNGISGNGTVRAHVCNKQPCSVTARRCPCIRNGTRFECIRMLRNGTFRKARIRRIRRKRSGEGGGDGLHKPNTSLYIRV